jgi:hypothetical protein
MSGEHEARDRLRCYSRRWRVLPTSLAGQDSAYQWLQAYLRRMRVLDRRPIYEAPKVTFIGNAFDLVQWIPREGDA